MGGVARVTFVALLFAVLGMLASCEKEKEGVSSREHGTFSHIGEVTEAQRGVKLFYGLPVGGARGGAVGPEWGEKRGAKAKVSELPGIHRAVLGEEFGGKGKVWFSVVTRYEWMWTLPDGVSRVALEPGQPLMLRGYAPVESGIEWRMERTAKETRLYATAYSLALRSALSGARSERTIPKDVERIQVLNVYCQ